ncbi:uncharacterized protein IWZ02DRAFT_72747 [Phyllosticta citriasiana]|uniref:uncharacterized protein n=1 Tax=Phyllosticta citriasiana TaxID=595635 RepID=UPI0030FDF51B
MLHASVCLSYGAAPTAWPWACHHTVCAVHWYHTTLRLCRLLVLVLVPVPVPVPLIPLPPLPNNPSSSSVPLRPTYTIQHSASRIFHPLETIVTPLQYHRLAASFPVARCASVLVLLARYLASQIHPLAPSRRDPLLFETIVELLRHVPGLVHLLHPGPSVPRSIIPPVVTFFLPVSRNVGSAHQRRVDAAPESA